MTPCLVMLFHVCAFDPSNVYVLGDASWQIAGDWTYRYKADTSGVFHPQQALIGRLEAGVEVPLSADFLFRYGVEHRSNIYTADRGEERAFVGFEWKPWGRP